MKSIFGLIASLSLFVAIAACSGGGKDGGAGSASEAPGGIAATVNDEVIPVDDVKKVAHNFNIQNIQPDPMAEGDTFEAKLYYTAVNRLVEQTLIMQEVKKQGITVSEDQVQNGVGQIKMRAGGEENFQRVLDEYGISMEDIVRDTRINLTVQEYYKTVVSEPPTVAEEDIQTFYDENAEEYAPQPEVHARHILIRTRLETPNPDPAAGEGQMDAAQIADARDRAEKILKEARSTKDFAELARTRSEDETTAPNGGDLGWFRQGRMVAPFDSASFALNPGQISDVVETRFGYHIIKVEERRMSPQVSLETVHDNIAGMVQQQKAQDLFEAAVADLRAAATVSIQPPSPETLAEIGS
jgi:peptidyl-prolyl cis-trans isomerase C